jgi:hypothetical protein
MATDVDVQFFSHLNGLTLGNNWGDLIRLLDKALVSGIDFNQITAASIDPQGDVHITLYTVHNAMLFQVVELSGFAPSSLSQKYRIKGVPSTTELILKPQTVITETVITVTGAGKLGSLGYEIIFRDTNDVKRVYRAKNPTSQHPFIRVDETLSDGVNTYTSTYGKFAMVGLLENMTHIDDYNNTNVLQLPFDPSNPTKNWKITGTGTTVIRGWSKWYWSLGVDWASNSFITEATAASAATKPFTLVGDKDAFYMLRSTTSDTRYKGLIGCGTTNTTYNSQPTQSWFLMSMLKETNANTVTNSGSPGGLPLVISEANSKFYIPQMNVLYGAHSVATPILPDFSSGNTTKYASTNIPALEIPFYDDSAFLRGSLKHIYYAGKVLNITYTTPLLSDNSMYVADCSTGVANSAAGFYFYLGELE